MTLEFPDGTVIGFDNHFDEDEWAYGYMDVTIWQTAHVISGTPRPDTTIYYISYVARELNQEDDEGFSYDYHQDREVVGQQFIPFDNLSYLTMYSVEATRTWDYYDKPDIVSHDERQEIAYVDAAGHLTRVWHAIDPAAMLIDQPGDRVGFIWADTAGPGQLELALVTVNNRGGFVTRDELIDVTGIAPGPTPPSAQVLGVALLTGGEMAVALRIEGGVQLGQFSSRFDLIGSLDAIRGTLLGLVGLPDGGFIVGNVVRDASGTGATLQVRGYDEDHLRSTVLSIDITDFQGAGLALQDDGTVAVSWNDGGTSHSQDYLPNGVTRHGDGGSNDLIGTTWRDTLLGKDGNDELTGRGGDDSLEGGNGSDVLVGGYGADTLNGGAGNDAVRYDSKVNVYLADASKNTGEAAGDVLIAIEQVRGSDTNDRLEGDAARNIFHGRDGDDVLSGGGGDDILAGNLGADRLRGGSGADQFRFNAPSDGGDTVADFESGIDMIGVRASGFGISSITLVSSAAPVATSASPTFLFSTADSLLSFDADGTGAQGTVAIATLTDVHALSSADFLLI